ncbi:MAG: phosphoglycerate dehydrogenase [Vicinamibacterales bacterium]
MKIVVADDMPADALLPLSERGWDVVATSGQSTDTLLAALADADALIVRSATKVTAALLEAGPHLRIVARAGTGVDTIDVPAATARGVLVVNAPGANSVSVAELAMAMMLSLARHTPAADRTMKEGKWEKKAFAGIELRGKTLGLVGFGRIGQEVARRAQAFEMRVVAHDPFLAIEVAQESGVELVSLDDLCRRAEWISLHLPSTPATRHIFGRERIQACRKGVRIINTARGELVDADALADAIEAGHVAGAGIDVFETEPPTDNRLQTLPQVVAAPHLGASTREGQQAAAVDTVAAVEAFLARGDVQNAVNLASPSKSVAATLQPYVALAERLGRLGGQLASGRIASMGVRTYGEVADSPHPIVATAAVSGLLSSILSEGVSVVNARQLAADRRIEIAETVSQRPRRFVGVVSLQVHTVDEKGVAATRWLEGVVAHGRDPRLVLVDGIDVDAPLDGTVLVICNDDRPGVVGGVGTVLGDHGINIASLSLGRKDGVAVAIAALDIDEEDPAAVRNADPDMEALERALRAVPAVKDVWIARLS